MFNTLNVSEMMEVNGGFYYVPKYKDGNFVKLEQVSNDWGVGGYKCFIYSYKTRRYEKSKKYPWE